jgi:hypothetical protein
MRPSAEWAPDIPPLISPFDENNRTLAAADTKDFARIHLRYPARLPGVAKMQPSFALREVARTTAEEL